VKESLPQVGQFLYRHNYPKENASVYSSKQATHVLKIWGVSLRGITMTSTIELLLPAATLPAVCPPTPIVFDNGGVFIRNNCWARVNQWLNDSVNLGNHACVDQLFDINPNITGWNASDVKFINPVLTPFGCDTFCGSEQGWYWDAGPRATTWIIPIDSVWSLMDKLYAWYACYEVAIEVDQRARAAGKPQKAKQWWRPWKRPNKAQIEEEHRLRIIATVFAGFEEVSGPVIRSKKFFKDVAEHLGRIGSDDESEADFDNWRLAAVSLAEDRTNDLGRTILAVILFIFQIVASFVAKIAGESTSPPGGRIASAVMLSWLLPVVLFSNILGGFPTQRSCLEIMLRLVSSLNRRDFQNGENGDTSYLPDSWKVYFRSLQSRGIVYSFRPFKTRSAILEGGCARATRLLLPVAASLPVVFGFIGAFVILWNASTPGFSCRHLWLIGVFIAWIASACLTWLSSLIPYLQKGNRHWWFVLLKDFVIGIPSILMVFLSTVGYFNSCYCWSVSLSLRKLAYFPLNTDPGYEEMNKKLYPIVVGVCVGVEIIFVCVVVFCWRRGLAVMRWGETRKQKEWLDVVAEGEAEDELQHGTKNMFIFWAPGLS
jgi:hypothetical protein